MAAPDLTEVQTPVEFMAALRDYRASRPPRIKTGYRHMAIRCGQARTATPLREALIADDLPNLKTLRAILDGLEASQPDHAAFIRAWHRLAEADLAAALTGGPRDDAR